MNNLLLEKTDKGREEIATRKYKLSSKLRSLLVMIDGRATAESLLKNVSAIGLDKNSIDELMQGGFVRNANSRETD